MNLHAVKHVAILASLSAALAQSSSIFEMMVCPSGDQLPRNSEGDVAILKGGRLLLAYTEFQGADGSDWGRARIAGKTSSDGGRSWSAPFTVVANEGRMNVMDANLLRLKSGKLAVAYSLKNSRSDCRVMFRTSSDEGKTWSEAVTITAPPRYWGINNNRLAQLRSGRLLAPVFVVEDWEKSHHTRAVVWYSDDEGRTWKSSEEVDIARGPRGADEPAVVELRDGRLLMIIRSDLGKIFRSYSRDGGRHWTAAEPTALDSPTAPASVARIPSTGDLLLIWNNTRPGRHVLDRFPLTAAISRDEGQTWGNVRNLDETPGYTYAYTSIMFPKNDRVLLTYYANGRDPKEKEDHSGRAAISLKLKMVPVAWFYGK